jgi:hypothetical protein
MILAAGLAQLPEKLGRSGVAASRAWQGLDHYAPNRHDIGSTTARSVDELALIRDTISHYAPVLIAPLSIQIRRAGVQGRPEFFCSACHRSTEALCASIQGRITGPLSREARRVPWLRRAGAKNKPAGFGAGGLSPTGS